MTMKKKAARLLLALPALVLLLGPAACRLRLSEDKTWIAYTHNVDPANTAYNHEIHLCRADGSGDRVLTAYAGAAFNSPAWSPDGTRIAFSYNNDIWAQNKDGTGLTQLTSTGEYNLMPVWSPDGTRIAFVAEHAGVHLYIIALASNDPANPYQRRMTVNGGLSLDLLRGPRWSWSPQGDRIAFPDMVGGAWHLFVRNAEDLTGSSLVDLTPAATGTAEFDVAWSPRGDRIAYEREMMIYTNNLTGTNERPIASDDRWYEQPSWSPNGRRIACASTSGAVGDYRQIWLMNADETGGASVSSFDGNHSIYQTYSLSWSPDGEKIACVIVDSTEGNNQIHIVNTDGSGQVRLVNHATNDIFPAWSPR